MTRTLTAALTLAAALALAGCGTDNATSSGAPATFAANAVPAPQSNPVTAESVIRDLAARVPTLQPVIFYDAATDPNHQLGRPGQYTSKGAFSDSRVRAADVADARPGSVGNGGGVEVFPTAGAARARAEYIQRVSKGMPALGEYDYLAGPVLLRLSTALTPEQAASYTGPLREATGAEVEGPVVAS